MGEDGDLGSDGFLRVWFSAAQKSLQYVLRRFRLSFTDLYDFSMVGEVGRLCFGVAGCRLFGQEAFRRDDRAI